jgi:hypothetical protein
VSADAKIWQADDGDWLAVHDGDCGHVDGHHLGRYDLRNLIEEVELCLETPGLRWEFRVYPDGIAGLRGFLA